MSDTAPAAQLPPALQALKEEAQARERAARDAVRREEEAQAAMNRDALLECVEASLERPLLASVEIDLAGVDAACHRHDLAVRLPGHHDLVTRFDRNGVTWKRTPWTTAGHFWRVWKRGCAQDFADLGRALAFAEMTREELERPPAAGDEDDVPF